MLITLYFPLTWGLLVVGMRVGGSEIVSIHAENASHLPRIADFCRAAHWLRV